MRNGPDHERSRTLLILAQAFPPDNVSGAARPGRFAKYLPGFGYAPIVVAGRSPSKDYAAHPFHVERVPGAAGECRRERIGAWTLGRLQRFFWAYNDHLPWIAHAIAAAQRIFREANVDAVLSTSPPIATHLSALWLKQRNPRLKWIADFRDPFYGNPFRTRKWLFSFDRHIEKKIVEVADTVIANTDAVADLWRRRYPEHAHKIVLIWNGFDPAEEIGPVINAPRPYRVITHTGTLYGGRSPLPLLESIQRLIAAGKLQPSALRIRLIGPMEPVLIERSKAALDDLNAQGCLELVNQMVPQEEARAASAGSDYLLLFDFNETGAVLQAPAKVFEYIRIGRPILVFTQENSPAERILAQSGIAHRLLYPHSTRKEVDDAVSEFLTWPAEARKPSTYFEEQFNGRLQTRHLCAVLDGLLEPRRERAREGQPA